MANKTENRTINMYINGQPVYNEIGSMERAYRKLNRHVKTLDTNSDKYRQGVKDLSKLQGNLTAHRNQIRNVESAWSKASSVAMGFVKGFILVRGVQAVTGALRDAYSMITNYQSANSNLQAVLGKTAEQTQELRDQQLQLGRSTAFSASQATDAQTELAKLGFTIKEITDLTPQVLNLAAASGTDLPNAAAIAGATMRQFGLDTSQAGRVVDVMAKSFSSSALDIEKFRFAMTQAAPAAAAAGISLERTTALISVLVDRGIRAESAGTGLRAIFGRLAQSGMSWNAAMEKINSSTDKTKTAINLFGLEAANQALILAQTGAQIDELDESYQNATGSSEKMAAVKLDNLTGDVTILKSAWEGLVLTIENGEGPIARTFRSFVQGVTNVISGIQTISQMASDSDTSFFLMPFVPGAMEAAKRRKALEQALAESSQEQDFGRMQKIIAKLEEEQSQLEEGSSAYKLYAKDLELVYTAQRRLAEGKIGEGAEPVIPEIPTVAGSGDETGSKEKVKTPEEIRADKAKAALEALALVYQEEKLMIDQARISGLIDAEEHERQLRELEMASLLMQKAALEEIGASSFEVTQKYQQLEIQALKDLDSARIKSAEEKEKASAREKKANEEAATAERARQEAAIHSAALQGVAAAEGADSVEEGVKRTLNAIRGIIKGYMAEAIAATMAKTVAEVPAPLGLILAAAAGGAASILFDTLIPAYEEGTSYSKSGTALVGEKGPELVNLPEGSKVTTAQDTRNLLYGGASQPNFNNVPNLSGGSMEVSGMMDLAREFSDFKNEISMWQRTLSVRQSQRELDDYNDRRSSNIKRVKNTVV